MSGISRVTTFQQAETMIGFISKNSAKYNKLVEESSSGIRVNRASDDPVAANKILDYTAQINLLNGYMSNIKYAQSELNATDSAFNFINELISKAKDYATQASNGTYSQSDLDAIKTSVDSIIDNIISYSNTSYNDKYLFSGTATSTEPYSYTKDADGNYTSITYNGTEGNNYRRYVNISEGTTVAVNVKGDDVFGYYNDADDYGGLFGNLVNLSNALASGDSDAISTCMDNLGTDLDTVLLSQTKLASVGNQMEMTYSSLNKTITNLTEYRSNLQDADLSETLVDLQSTQLALQASYSLTAQVLSMNLLNYL